MTTVTPIAKEKYERREEQGFRDWARRNLQQIEQTAFNALSTTAEAAAIWDFANLPEYADDTAAGVGGLTQGQFYRTATGVVMVKL